MIDVYVYISGGVLQGASASNTENLNFVVFDLDNYEARYPQSEEYMTPEQWDEMIKTKTAAGEIQPAEISYY